VVSFPGHCRTERGDRDRYGRPRMTQADIGCARQGCIRKEPYCWHRDYALMDTTMKNEKPARKPSEKMPAAGPHAQPELTNPDATPGSGMFQPLEGDDENMQPSG